MWPHPTHGGCQQGKNHGNDDSSDFFFDELWVKEHCQWQDQEQAAGEIEH
jgi:hypothetical protein